jgi:YegS/Rv2252/BmrU family lipid kinase
VNVLAIVNPRAGVIARSAIEAVRTVGGRWKGLEMRLTERRGHARELAQDAVREGREIVIACGGDGTVNEVAWGLLGSTVTLGLVPAGSGNGLGRVLGISRNPVRALTVLADAVPRLMDVGMINDKPFLNVAGAGFDAAVGHAYDEHGRRTGRRGLLNYFRVGIGTAWGYRSEELSLDFETASPRPRRLIVAFANGQQYGGGALIAPQARLDDGQLDVVTVDEAPLLEMLWHAPLMPLGQIRRYRRYQRTLAERAVLTGVAPIVFHRDGEPEPPADRLEVRILPRALRILVPKSVANRTGGPFAPENGTGANL